MFDGSPDTLTLTGAAPTLDLPARFSRRPHLLANALAAAKASAPDLAGLADFIVPRLPRRPLASDTLHTGAASSAAELLDTAAAMPWIAFNNTDWTNAVGTDCDHDEAEDLVAEFMPYLRQVDPEAPQPLIVADWWTGRAHVTWFLGKPVFTGAQPDVTVKRSAPVLRTLEAVRLGLCAVLRGDPGFTNRLTKNPFARGPTGTRPGLPAFPLLWDWYTDTGCPMRFHTLHGAPRPIGLLTLWRALRLWREDTGQTLPSPRRARVRPDPADTERGARLFNAARFPVYDLGTSDLATIAAIVDEQAARLGSPAGPRQRMGIARSIARFMRTRWTGRTGGATQSRRRGVMELEAASLDLPERQALGGKYAARRNADDTDRRIAEAVARLQSEGRRLTQKAIALHADVCERTVRARWTKPAKQCPSGIDRRSLRPSAASLPLRNPPSFPAPPTLAAKAAFDRAIRRTVAALVSAAEVAAKPGALPPLHPGVPPELARVPEVHQAEARARREIADARRRAAARDARRQTSARRMDYEARLRADPAAAWAWWREQAADMDAEWDARESSADPADLSRTIELRRAVVGGRWRSWRAADRAVRGVVRRRPRPDELAAIPY